MVELQDTDIPDVPEYEGDFDFEQILEVLKELPDGYRAVFNLYVLEGYKHKEIAEILNISINTSKSQLILAKKRMIEQLKKKDKFIFKT
jgi:RNA polymerase sigma-70 factor (ECF subfamily)